MEELAFDNEIFDLVMTSMALYETTAEVHRSAIKQVARVWKKGATFLLVDRSKSQFELWGAV